jgi:hypothetical protein
MWRGTPSRGAGELHLHGRKHVVLVARIVRVPLYPVDERHVTAAAAWLDQHWRGEVYVPEELLPLVAVA